MGALGAGTIGLDAAGLKALGTMGRIGTRMSPTEPRKFLGEYDEMMDAIQSDTIDSVVEPYITEIDRLKNVREDIFNEMADGQVMSDTLEPYGLKAGTVRRWISSDEYWFYEYRKARLLMAQALAEEALEISRYTDSRTVTRDKLRIDTLQWAAVRMNPAEVGDKQAIQTESKQTVEIKLVEETPSRPKP